MSHNAELLQFDFAKLQAKSEAEMHSRDLKKQIQ